MKYCLKDCAAISISSGFLKQASRTAENLLPASFFFLAGSFFFLVVFTTEVVSNFGDEALSMSKKLWECKP
jgi:hypothetical protein